MKKRNHLAASVFAITTYFSLFLIPVNALANEIRKIDFPEYLSKVATLNEACISKGMHSFSGFCLSQPYGKTSLSNPTQTSITIGLEIASFEYFYSACEHSDFPLANDALVKIKRVLEATKYLEEMKIQQEALDNYVGSFYSCKTRSENDATILKSLKWFEYMTRQYSNGSTSTSSSATSIVISSKSIEYAGGEGNDRISLVCDESGLIDSACSIRGGTSGSARPVRFVAQFTQYAPLLRNGAEKASAREQRPLRALDIPILRDLAFEKCHPAAESNGISGDLLQLCIPSDPSKVILFARALCSRCEFEPIVLDKQLRPVP